MNDGFFPAESLILKVSIAAVLNRLLRSFKSLSILSLVLVIIVVRVRFSSLSTLCGQEMRNERLGPEEVDDAVDKTRILAKTTQNTANSIAEGT
jgi:ABC-type enterochelin transport system permease subunit